MCGDSAPKPELVPYELMARVAAETLKLSALDLRRRISSSAQR